MPASDSFKNSALASQMDFLGGFSTNPRSEGIAA